MKAAVLGCGTMGAVHARQYMHMDQVELVGVCDAAEERAAAVAAACGTTAYKRFEELLEKAAPDVVSICLPTWLHEKYTILAAEAGVHVICEKPIAASHDEADRMAEACSRQGVRLFIAHVVRFFPAYENMKKSVEEGAIGRIGVVHAKRAVQYPHTADGWYREEQLSGGVILDLMIHDIDYMRSVLGEAESVFAQRSTSPGVDYAAATLRFTNGAIANLEALWGYPGPFTTNVEFAGSGGLIRFDSSRASSVVLRQAAGGEDMGDSVVAAKYPAPTFKSPAHLGPYRLELEHFIRCIMSGEEARITLHDAREALRIAQAAAISANSGEPVDLQHFKAR